MTQETALNILKLGHNVYLTGAAGSGKTYVLNQYIKYLRDAGIEVAVTASTGIAATHMGGVTIHSWSGLGIKNSLNEADISTMMEKQSLVKRFDRVKVLIIDEVSMMHHFRLDMVDRVLRAFRNTGKPFGGIQVVLCGDFFQLPPVCRPGEPAAKFIYHSHVWRVAQFKICYLEEQHRQTDDQALRILNDIRNNEVTEDTLEILKTRCVSPEVIDRMMYRQGGIEDVSGDPGEGDVYIEYEESEKDSSDKIMSSADGSAISISIEPTRLFTHNIHVDTVNDKHLDQIDDDEYEYHMEEQGKDHLIETLKKSCLAPACLRLKIGAKVMFVKNNYEEGYVNGTLGIVTALDEDGPTITVLGSNPSQHQSTSGSVHKKIQPPLETWSIEEDGKVKASISQFPIRLAWAITVHKSQGMSLDAVEVDLSKSFERGMGYVALSRARTLDGLVILGLNDISLRVHDEVLMVDEKLRKASVRAEEELALYTEDQLAGLQKSVMDSMAPTEKDKQKKLSTIEQTKLLVEKKMNLKKMATERGLTEETIIDHIEQLVAEDPLFQQEVSYLKSTIPFSKQKVIKAAFVQIFLAEHKDVSEDDFTMSAMRTTPLAAIKHILGNKGSYKEIRLMRVVS